MLLDAVPYGHPVNWFLDDVVIVWSHGAGDGKQECVLFVLAVQENGFQVSTTARSKRQVKRTGLQNARSDLLQHFPE